MVANRLREVHLLKPRQACAFACGRKLAAEVHLQLQQRHAWGSADPLRTIQAGLLGACVAGFGLQDVEGWHRLQPIHIICSTGQSKDTDFCITWALSLSLTKYSNLTVCLAVA